MARGDRSAVDSAENSVSVLFCQLPPELIFLVDQYKIYMRMPTRTEAVRRLLESHPALTDVANRLYNGK